MLFSELKLLSEDLGLSWEESGCLSGIIRDYPVLVCDSPETRRYTVTVFCRYRKEADEPLRKGVTALVEKLPKNCVTGRKSEVNFQQISLNASLLYQENSFYLVDFVNGLCELADSLDLLPSKLQREAAAKEPAPKKAEPLPPKNEVKRRFDRYSVRGLLGALIGAFAMAAISGAVIDNRPSNIGGLLSSWAAGALISAVTIADYRFLAKKIDIFGTIACSVITAFGCVFASVFGGVRMLKRYTSLLFPEITLGDTIRNYSYYQIIFPEASGEFPLLLVKCLVSAAAAAAVFYTLYFRNHQDMTLAE
ncbi:MAG: hypothetical protein NC203_01635 [Firmicutes bacterium]|nr:hypothetical protein [[Eubacterium] siraeum]MCM1487043.1 hypothetical protein [Bacillota bacterium]